VENTFSSASAQFTTTKMSGYALKQGNEALGDMPAEFTNEKHAAQMSH